MKNHKKWNQKRMDDCTRRLLSYRIKNIFGFAPTLDSDTPNMEKYFLRRATRYLGIIPTAAVNHADMFVKGAEVIVHCRSSGRSSGRSSSKHSSPLAKAAFTYDYCRGEIMSDVRPSDTKVNVFLRTNTKTIEFRLKDLIISKGLKERLRRQKKRAKDVERLEEFSWFGMDIPEVWTTKKKFQKKQRKALKKFERYVFLYYIYFIIFILLIYFFIPLDFTIFEVPGMGEIFDWLRLFCLFC